nr:hypothetical protein CFP56_61788 [Quercus suber]
MSKSAVRSREEDEELQRSTKKAKDSHCRGASLVGHHPHLGGESLSFKEKLIGEIPRAFKQAFDFENHMDTEVESDDEFSEIPPGEMSKSAVRSREEDEELQRSTKKAKDSHCRGASLVGHHPHLGGESLSFKEKLIGEIPRAFKQAFDFENHMDTEVESDDEFSEIPPGEVVVKLSLERKASIRAL